jgi:neutral trehalase
MWDPTNRFYFDLTWEGKPAPVKTIGAFWTLVAGVASPAQTKDLMRELSNPQTFKRLHRVPTLAADQNGYDPAGGYWCGAVWAPTSTMVIRGLEQYGQG